MEKKLTLEQRIARLESVLNKKSAVKNEARKKNYEATADSEGALDASEAMAAVFERQTGHRLASYSDELVSPMYGTMDLDDEIPEDDPDTRYVFAYTIDGEDDLTACMIPSDNMVQVYWARSGCALNPKTGEWFEADCAQDGAFKMSMWKKPIDLEALYDDEEYEDLKRNRRNRKCEAKRSRVKNKGNM